MTETKTRDPMIWRELTPMADGFVPAVKRVYVWTGRSRGVPCRIVCELSKKVSEGVYLATACYAHNVAYLCRDRVRVEDLEEVCERSSRGRGVRSEK